MRSTTTRPFRLKTPSKLTLAIMTAMGMPAGYAATYTVTNLDDSGPGSLRQAVLDANNSLPSDTINFAANVKGVITLASRIDILGKMTINGPGADVLTLDGNNATSIFLNNSPGATIAGLTLTKGRNDNASGTKAKLTVKPVTGYAINKVTGCGGKLAGTTYTTAVITTNCTVTATFKALTYVVKTKVVNAGTGTISPATRAVPYGKTTTFTVKPAVAEQMQIC